MVEPRSLAEELFLRLMDRDMSQRASFLRKMADPTEPTFEEEWLDFKSGFEGPAANPSPLADKTVKPTWSTALTGFANTGGGVLIWGVDARPMTFPSDPTKKIDAAGDLRLVPDPNALKVAFDDVASRCH